MTPAQRRSLNIESKGALQQYARDNCRALHMFYQSGTASKHWVVSHLPDPQMDVVVSALPTPIARSTSNAFEVSLVPWSIHFIDGEHRTEASIVFGEAFDFWTSFIYHNGIKTCREEDKAAG